MNQPDNSQPKVAVNTAVARPAASAPDPVTVSKFALAASAGDFMLSMGATRVAYDQKGEFIGSAVEYSSTNIMSPVIAKQLYLMLQATIENYENTFGVIPVDPQGLEKIRLAVRSAQQATSAKTAGSTTKTARTIKTAAKVTKATNGKKA